MKPTLRYQRSLTAPAFLRWLPSRPKARRSIKISRLKNLLTEAIWDKQHIDFSIDTDQEGSSNTARLKGALDFMRDSTVITMSPSALKLLERDWMFAPGNFISIQGKEWLFHQLALTNAEQSVSLNGSISPDPHKIVSLQLDKLDLSLLNVLSKNKFKGIANARIDVTSFYKDPMVFNDILIRDLTVDDFLVGNIQGVNKWDTLNRKFDIDLFIDRNDKRIVDLDGSYDPKNAKNALDIIAKLDKAEIKLLEPFLQDIFTQMGGTVSGNFTIKGPLSAPLIDGEGTSQSRAADGKLSEDPISRFRNCGAYPYVHLFQRYRTDRR